MRHARTSLLALLLATAAVSGVAVADDVIRYRVVDGAIMEPLTAEPGNPGRGRTIVRDMGRVTCLICHAMPIAEEPDHGGVGPPLSGVGARLSPGDIRLRIVDPKVLNPQSIMPSYYRIDGLNRVGAAYRGRTIYSPQEVEDVVAYLASLRETAP